MIAGIRDNKVVLPTFYQKYLEGFRQAAAEDNRGGSSLSPGWSIDLTKIDPETGDAWDLSKRESRAEYSNCCGTPSHGSSLGHRRARRTAHSGTDRRTKGAPA